MATTTKTSRGTPGGSGGSGSSAPDWGALAAQGLEFLEALAATVTPTPEEEAASSNFTAIIGALGHPADLHVQLDESQPKVVVVPKFPAGVDNYKIGDFRRGRVAESGTFDTATKTITLKSVNLRRRAVPLELYSKEGVLLARVIIDIRGT